MRSALRLLVPLATALAVAASLVLLPAPAAQAASGDLYRAVNTSRQAAGLTLLARDARLDAVAQQWSEQMVRSQDLAHNPALSGQVPGGWTRLGENVGYASSDSALHQAWMASSGHKANILGRYTSVGIGWAKDSRGRIWGTQVFATYAGVRAPAPAPAPSRFLLAATTPGPATADLAFGWSTDVPLVGDWNGDGVDTIGVRRSNTVHLRNSNTPGGADVSFAFGRAGDRVLVGDWNGDGVDTIGVQRGNLFYLANDHRGGGLVAFRFGYATDVPVVGDFDGDGRDSVGLRRGQQFHLADTLGGSARPAFAFGGRTDAPVAGDWDGDGVDTVGVRRGSTYYLAEGRRAEAGTSVVGFGTSTDRSVIGDFNRDGTDSLGVKR